MTRPVLDFSERKRQQQRQQRRPTGNTKKRIKYALSGAKDQMNSGGDGNGDDDDRKSDEKFLFTLMFLYCLILALIIYFGLRHCLTIMLAICLSVILMQ